MFKVLFVCVHNAARSQMAEAFLNRLGEGRFQAESAGLQPLNGINPYVIRAMAEIGYDISANKVKGVFDLFKQQRKYDLVIKVCDQALGQQCPIFPSALATLTWSFLDPAGFSGTDEEILRQVRALRDQISVRVEELTRVFVM